ncbi:Uncharacterized protein FWK35_00028685 [Aphis craccivora]|uniref:Uncharacterized protein n=1 Tax=Aphis craccivora TaxID=307492 RepID=A0A6G0VVL2_APHCR|nr:Uncharacterized protein FWK35_00028685 [Aphis craccivora]
MMEDSYLDVTADYIDDCKITQMQYQRNVQKHSDAVGDVRFSNNGLAFLFSEMQYEINGIEITRSVVLFESILFIYTK